MSHSGTIFISGAGRGLGRAMALHLAGPETRLLLHYGSSAESARQTAHQAQAKGAEAVLLQADLADPDARAAMMKQAAEAGEGRLRLMINNAAVYLEAGLLETTPEQWNRTMEINCNAVFHLTSLALPLLRAGAPSRVINLGDSGADRVVARLEAVPYHAAKLGVHLLTRSYAKALTGEGITVNMISPGFLENSVGTPPASIPAGRPGRFEDVLGALDYLLSDSAAYVSGANIVVSGGWNI
ncbi:MAG: SDR family oxidoreductase [SAR324 cluster bacterium]|nr:SDR family oxidoreductase [SAR324 cluster bacterium]MCH8887286.1 SDR family oxidoreductase [SAR324 cluster bacterium]